MEDDSHGFEWGVAEGMSPITTPSEPGLDCPLVQF